MNSLTSHLSSLRNDKKKAFVAYVMAGSTPNWLEHVEALVDAGTSAIEIGLPFSDPMMDGVVIQEAATAALQNGTTFQSIMTAIRSLQIDVPLVAMTYYNVFHHLGTHRAVGELRDAGFGGVIIPDLSLEEGGEWRSVASSNGLDTVLMIAPSTPLERVERIATTSSGFVYASGSMAVTGRGGGGGRAEAIVNMARAVTNTPVYVGIGISTPDQAHESALSADGVIVGSTIVREMLGGITPHELGAKVREFVIATESAG
jgi:tryptophan synthase alpha chain